MGQGARAAPISQATAGPHGPFHLPSSPATATLGQFVALRRAFGRSAFPFTRPADPLFPPSHPVGTARSRLTKGPLHPPSEHLSPSLASKDHPRLSAGAKTIAMPCYRDGPRYATWLQALLANRLVAIKYRTSASKHL